MGDSKIKKQESLHIQVYNLLRKDLLNGKLKPGEIIFESVLAKELGISRSPVREAIRQLEHEGLLVQKGSYIHVKEFTEKDMVDLYSCRKALESLAAELASQHITSSQVNALKESLEKSEEALHQNNVQEIVYHNTIFHDTIIKAANNPSLVQLLKGIRGQILFYRNAIFSYYHHNNYLHGHKEIFQAISNRNPNLARKYMEQHIDADINAFHEFIKIIKKEAEKEGV